MLENKTRYLLSNDYMENPLPFDGVSLVQLGRRYCEPAQIIAAHPHLNWFELTLVTKGSGTIITNGEETAVYAGDIYLSFPCDVHEICADKEIRLEYDFFSFTCANKSLGRDLKNITRNCRGGDKRVVQDDKISQLVGWAISEFISDEQPHAQTALTNIFQLILTYLIRDFNHIQQNTPAVSEPEVLCFQLMNYIDTHIYTLKKLEDLATKFNYSYGYLSGLFQRTTGKTLSTYYQNRKMETGKALVLEKKKSIGEIAEMLGYNLYSFSKAFKKAYGISPKNIQQLTSD